MKDINNIDELFKSGLQQEFPFDSKLWADVEGQLPGSPLKNSLWYFNLNSILLGVVLMACAFIPSDSIIKEVKQTKEISLLAEKENSDLNKDELLKPIESETNQSNADKQILNAEPLDSEMAEMRSNEKSTEQFNDDQEGSTIQASPIDQDLKNGEQTKLESSDDFSELKSSSETRTLVSSEAKRSFNQLKEEKIELENNVVEKAINRSIVLQELDQINVLGFKAFETQFTIGEAERVDENNWNMLKGKLKKREYYVELVTSRSFDLNKSISGTSVDVENFKGQHENSLHSESYGVNVLSNVKFLTLGLGVHLSKFYENVAYPIDREMKSFKISYDTTFNVINSTFNSGGHEVLLIEDEVVEVRTPNTVIVADQLRTQNVFKRIRIPVSLGYNRNLGSWMAGVRTSLIANYIHQQNGVYINQDLVQIQSFDEGGQFNQWNFGHEIAASIGYSLNEFVAVGGRFSYEYDISSYTTLYNSQFQQQNLGLWILWKPQY